MSANFSCQLESGVGRGAKVMQPETLTSWGIFFEKYNLIRNILLLAGSTLSVHSGCSQLSDHFSEGDKGKPKENIKPSVSLRVHKGVQYSFLTSEDNSLMQWKIILGHDLLPSQQCYSKILKNSHPLPGTCIW